jgi:hypothetical protein
MRDHVHLSDSLTEKVADVILRHLLEEYAAQVMQNSLQGFMVTPLPEPSPGPYAACSPAVQIFLHELEGLCRQHGMQLATSGSDGVQVWRLGAHDHPLHVNGIEDRTSEGL